MNDHPRAEFVLIESTGTSSADGDRFLRDAASLARAGHSVRVVLTQGAVVDAFPGASSTVTDAVAGGADIWVDRYSVEQRSLSTDRLMHARLIEMDDIAAELLAPTTKVVWH